MGNGHMWTMGEMLESIEKHKINNFNNNVTNVVEKEKLLQLSVMCARDQKLNKHLTNCSYLLKEELLMGMKKFLEMQLMKVLIFELEKLK